MISADNVKKLVEEGIPDSTAEVRDLTGTSDHYAIRVRSVAFAGKSLIEQHKMVHSALGEHLGSSIHAVELDTGTE